MEKFIRVYQNWKGLNTNEIFEFEVGKIDTDCTYFDENGHRYNYVRV